MVTGSCLCGAVAYEVTGALQPGIVCHCIECRKQSGHAAAASAVERSTLTMTRKDGLTWYKASDYASRGFCRVCGSTLFWQRDESPLTHVLLGAVDGASGAHIAQHFWVSEKGDNYEIADGLPQIEED